jgi:hypothetical protein
MVFTNNIQRVQNMINRTIWAGLLALTLINTAYAVSEEGSERGNPSIYKHVHKPSNIRMPWMVPAGTVTARPATYRYIHKPSNTSMPWMVPAGTVTARPDGQTAVSAKNNEKTSGKQ